MWSQWLRPGAEDGAMRGGHDQDHRHVGIEGKHVRGSGDAAGNRGARRGYWTGEREDVFTRTGGGWTDGILRVSVSPKVPVSKGCERCWLFGIRAASMATVLRPEQKQARLDFGSRFTNHYTRPAPYDHGRERWYECIGCLDGDCSRGDGGIITVGVRDRMRIEKNTRYFRRSSGSVSPSDP